MRKVIYERDTQRRLIRELVEPVCEAVKGLGVAGASLEEAAFAWAAVPLLTPIAASFLECGSCFKNPGFEEEAEWRLIYLNQRNQQLPDNGLRMRATGTGLVPYVERQLARPGQAGQTPAIREVVVGPTAHPDLAEEATAQLLTREGYADRREMVRHSAIPLRV